MAKPYTVHKASQFKNTQHSNFSNNKH